VVRNLLPAVLAFALLTLPQTCLASFSYGAILDAANENNPMDTSTGTAFAQIDIDSIANTMHLHITFSGLTSGVTGAHIHSATALPLTGTAGVATTVPSFAGFPLGMTSGTYDMTLDMTQASNYNPAFLTAHGGSTAMAEQALFSSFAAGTAYLNLHTTNFAGGEVLGFIQPLGAVPEPSSIVLCGIAAVTGLAVARIRRSSPARSA